VPLSRFRLHCGERFRYEYDFTADWKLDIRLERVLPFDPKRALPSCIGGRRAAPPEDCAGAWDYLKRLDWHKSHLPIDELNIMAKAMRRFLDSGACCFHLREYKGALPPGVPGRCPYERRRGHFSKALPYFLARFQRLIADDSAGLEMDALLKVNGLSVREVSAKLLNERDAAAIPQSP
jgi:Plasmid pRiA4b ORF-3-like protein